MTSLNDFLASESYLAAAGNFNCKSFAEWLSTKCYVDLSGQAKHARLCLCKSPSITQNSALDLEEK